jgi:hypothetical protein
MSSISLWGSHRRAWEALKKLAPGKLPKPRKRSADDDSDDLPF